jgi:hypothetical protein
MVRIPLELAHEDPAPTPANGTTAGKRTKKIVIVFPPLTMPTSPPLGASMLKGFIERELPEWQVKVLDLNVWTFDRLFDALARGGPLDPRAIPEGVAGARDLTRAAAAFRGQNNHEFYTRPDLYDRYGEVFLRFTEACTQDLARLCDAHEQGAPLAPIFQDYLDLILSEKPDVVGISMIFSEQLPIGALLGKLIRKRTGLPVVFGGSCFADAAEHFLKWYPESADVIISGEGEEALKVLLTDFTALERVPSAVFFKDGMVHKVPKSFPKDIDFYGAPDFGDLDLKSYYSPEPVIPLLLSRGCYWRRCTFCVHYRSAGLTYRMHTMDFTIEMLKDFVAKGVRNFAFIDEMISPNHFTKLAKGIKEAKLNISYYALTKPSLTFTPEILSIMAESGCKYLLWGLESGNQRVLDLMDKGSKVEEVSKVLKDAHAAGIANHVFVICGFPTETEEEFAQTIKFLDDHKHYIYAVHRGTFSLEPESPIFEHQERFEITRSWMIRDTPSGGRWGYECKRGMSMERVKEAFVTVLPLFRVFNPYARYAANFRDHALLLYSHARLRPEARPFPKITYHSRPPSPYPSRFRDLVRVYPVDYPEHNAVEITADCKSGLVAVADSGTAPDVPNVDGLTAEQIAEFFANDPNFSGRFIVTGN